MTQISYTALERASVRPDEDQLHLRRRSAAGANATLLVLHASSPSSWFMEDFVVARCDSRAVTSPGVLATMTAVIPTFLAERTA